MIRLLILLTSVVTTAYPQASATASRPSVDEWAEHRGGPLNDGLVPGPSPSFARTAWRTQLTAPVFSAPAVSGGRVYVATAENQIVALDARTGRILFERRAAPYSRNEEGISDCDRFTYSGPLVAFGRVYVGHESGVLYAVDAITGEPAFATKLGDCIWASPKTDGHVVCVSTVEGDFCVVDPRSGEILSRTVVGYEVGSTPALLGREAWLPSSGDRMTRVDLETGRAETIPATFSSSATPAVGCGMLFLRTVRGEMAAYDLLRREVVWRVKEPGDFCRNGPAFDGERAYFAVPGAVRAYGPLNGNRIWEMTFRKQVFSSPIVVGGRLVFGTEEGTLYALDARTGEVFRTLELGERLTGSVAAAGGRVFVAGATTGAVFCID